MRTAIIAILLLTAPGCGLLSYTPQSRNIETRLAVLGCEWTWKSTMEAQLVPTCPQCGKEVEP